MLQSSKNGEMPGSKFPYIYIYYIYLYILYFLSGINYNLIFVYFCKFRSWILVDILGCMIQIINTIYHYFVFSIILKCMKILPKKGSINPFSRRVFSLLFTMCVIIIS